VLLAVLGRATGAGGAAAVGFCAASGMVSRRRAGAMRCRFMVESITHGYDVCEISLRGALME